jgi:hypothetical protein
MDTITEFKINWVIVDDQPSAILDTACCESASLASGHPLVDEEWAEALQTISVDLERTARETNALQRRREIKQATDLLRLVLAYCVCDWSLRLVGLWATLKNIGCLSDVAVMKRVQKAKPWLELLVGAILKARRLELKAANPVRVRIVDGSSISKPGSQGTDYRLHLSLDLGSQRIDGIEVTDVHGAETLARHPSQPGDIWLADRGYARGPGVGAILKAKGEVVLRIGWATFPLECDDGIPFDLFAWLRQIPALEPSERTVSITTPEGRFSLRLIAQRLPQEVAEKNRRRIRRQASRKGKTPDKRSMEAAGYIFLVTSLSTGQWTAAQVLALYRLRWQVELIFKRLKSILDLDQLRAKGPALAQTYLLGKVLAALIIEAMTDQATQRCPTLFTNTQCPVSAWRWTTAETFSSRRCVVVYLGIIFWTNYPISAVTFVLAPGISGRIRRLSQESFSAACWGHRLWLLLP